MADGLHGLGSGPFALPPDAARAFLQGAYLARVVSVQDPQNLARVQLRLLNQHTATEAEIWARVAAPFAGSDRGALLIPDVDDEVLVIFVNGDARFPIVVGGLWNGAAQPPEGFGGDGSRVDRWTFTGKNGTRIAMIEESVSNATIILETPNGVTATFTDEAGGKVEIECAGTTVKIDTQGVSITTAKLKVDAGQVNVSAGMVQVDTALAKFSGVVQCSTLIATSVVGTSYTPGAGNVW